MSKKDIEKFVVIDIIGGTAAVSSDDGQKVFDFIKNSLDKGKDVELSFKGVDLLVSSFLNSAVGQLYGVFEDSKIKSSLSVIEMNPEDIAELKKVVERAKQYFNDKEGTEKAISEVLDDDN